MPSPISQTTAIGLRGLGINTSSRLQLPYLSDSAGYYVILVRNALCNAILANITLRPGKYKPTGARNK